MMSLNYLLASASDADVHPPPHPQELPISGFFLADNRKSPSWKRHSPPMSLNPKSLNLFSTSAEEEEEEEEEIS
jgi:hypothetical protein